MSNALKRERQNIKRRLHNREIKGAVRSAVKDFIKSLAEGNKEVSKAKLTLAAKKLDSAVNKKVLHRNMASRKISRLTKQFNKSYAA